MKLTIAEVFASLQGEAGTSGFPTTIIRTTGCNLRCLYCDTAFAWEGGEEVHVDELVARVRRLPWKRVLVTGGEPLLQREAVVALSERLLAEKYQVRMETNGSLPVADLPAGVVAVIDVKTPGSGMSALFNQENLRNARRHHDEFKFVIAHPDDLPWALDLVARHRLDTRYRCYFSPCHGAVDPAWLAGAILASGRDLALSLQLHKLLWPKAERGV